MLANCSGCVICIYFHKGAAGTQVLTNVNLPTIIIMRKTVKRKIIKCKINCGKDGVYEAGRADKKI